MFNANTKLQLAVFSNTLFVQVIILAVAVIFRAIPFLYASKPFLI
ncbi:putative membrane protein [Vibrio harveyi]|nr:putative membrane protein [Vibrio harveyi]